MIVDFKFVTNIVVAGLILLGCYWVGSTVYQDHQQVQILLNWANSQEAAKKPIAGK